MTKVKNAKLKLHRETLAILDQETAATLVGGTSPGLMVAARAIPMAVRAAGRKTCSVTGK